MKENEIATYLKLLALVAIHAAFVMAFIEPIGALVLCVIYFLCALSNAEVNFHVHNDKKG